MMRRDGSSPRMKAGKATEAIIDFSDLGGILMISRLISPRRTRSSWYAIASRCQLLIKVWPGVRVIKTFSTKVLKSLRSRASRMRALDAIVMALIVGRRRGIRDQAGWLSQILREDRLILIQHLAELERGLGRFGIAIDQR